MIPDLCQFSVSDKLTKVLIYLTLANSHENKKQWKTYLALVSDINK